MRVLFSYFHKKPAGKGGIMKKNTGFIIGICVILIVLSGILFLRVHGSQNSSPDASFSSSAISVSDESSEVTSQASETEPPENTDFPSKCAVYITGAVKSPGLFRYSGTARVSDAIDFAGGFSGNAARNSVNLARMLEDGEQITILTKKQAKQKKKKAKSVPTDQNSNTVYSNTTGKVNINTASETELMTLPGIGQAKALLIINYRKEHGNFSKPEDLMQISGIKEGIYNKIKEYITI